MVRYPATSIHVLPRTGAFSTVVLYRSFGGVARDVVHQSGLILTLLLASVVVLYLPWLMEFGRPMQRVNKLYESAPQMFLVMLTTTAYLVGLVLSAEESENNTWSLLDTLPVPTSRHLLYKLAAGTILVVTWLLAAGIIMGFLSGTRFGLLRGLVTAEPQLVSVIHFGRSGLITFLQVVAVFMTGLLMGLLFSTLTAAAIAGFLVYGSFLFLMSRFLENREEMRVMGSTVGLLAWIGLGGALYAPAIALNRRRNHSAAAEATAVSTDVSKGMYLHLAGLAFDPPNRHLLRVPALLLLLASPLLVFVPPAEAGFLLLCTVPVLAGLLGACAWSREERVAARFLAYALPVSRDRIFWPRIGAIGMASVLVGTSVSFMLGIYFARHRYFRGDMLVSGFQPTSIALVLGIVVTAYLGALFRLFFRSMLIAAILSSLVVGCWGPVFVIGMGQLAELSGERFRVDIVIHALWCTLVGVGLPIFCMWIAFCRSRLLELPDARRGRIAVVVFLLLVVWGSFLLATPPTHLLAILFG